MQDEMTIHDHLLTILMNDQESYDAITHHVNDDAKHFRSLITTLVEKVKHDVPDSADGKYSRYLFILDIYGEMVDQGFIRGEEVEELLVEAGYTYSLDRWRASRMMLDTPSSRKIEEKPKMSFTFEEKVFIDGDDASTLKDEYLFTVIAEAQNQIRELEKIEKNFRPDKLNQEVQRIRDFIFKVKNYVDVR